MQFGVLSRLTVVGVGNGRSAVESARRLSRPNVARDRGHDAEYCVVALGKGER